MKANEPEKASPQEYTLVIPPDSLRFDSRFESGNLSKAIRLSDSEYNLVLDYDTETQSYTQWYHFSVKGATQGKRVRFNIVNLLKYESLSTTASSLSCTQRSKATGKETALVSHTTKTPSQEPLTKRPSSTR
jgi:hypothetical protein